MLLPFDIPPDLPVLIAGPTASGKSALALHIAETSGGAIINADALQVYNCWQSLSARPSDDETARAPHHLYGHVGLDQDYSVGTWLREVEALLTNLTQRPIIIGGTGLYFRALTEGLAEIPPTPAEIRELADERIAAGHLAQMISELDSTTASRIDLLNPIRVQRAWEVQRTTGRGLADWHDNTPAPLLPLNQTFPIVMDADKDWLNDRIALRFRQMIEHGALEETRAVLPNWDPSRPWAKAIGAPELIAYHQDEQSLEHAIEAAIISSRQYAKRQRTWFRARMTGWNVLHLP